MATARAAASLARRWPYSGLLALLLATLFAGQLAGASTWGSSLGQISLVVLAYGVAAATAAPRVVRRGMALVVALVVAGRLVAHTGVGGVVVQTLNVFGAVVLGLAVLLLTVRALLTERGKGADALAGATFGYLMLAVVWALLFAQVQVLAPGSFALIEDGSDPFGQLLYFSLVTLTTLGYGDIAPATPLTRLLAGLEAAQGTLFLALFIGRILALASAERG
jgi:hypothetical protein